MIDDKNTVPDDTDKLWSTEYKISKLSFSIDNINQTQIVAGILHYALLGNRTKSNDYELSFGEDSVSWSESGGSHIAHAYGDSDLDRIIERYGITLNKTSEGLFLFEYKGFTFQTATKDQACLKLVLNSEVIVFPDKIKFDFDTIYPHYIQSKLWKAKASEIKKLANNKCTKCNNTKRLHCHHLTYKRLGCELPVDLLCVCERCHSKIHERKN